MSKILIFIAVTLLSFVFSVGARERWARPYTTLNNPTVITTGDTGWSRYSTPGTFAWDSAHLVLGSVREPQIQTPSGALASMSLRITAFALNKNIISYRMWCDTPENISSIRWFFSSNSGYTNYKGAYYGTPNFWRHNWGDGFVYQGQLTRTGNPDTAAINYIMFRVNPITGHTCKVTLGGITMSDEALTKGTVFFTFDGADTGVYALGKASMDGAGIKGTHYVNGSLLGSTVTMTLSNMLDLQNDGHTIGSHGYRHWNPDTLPIDSQTSNLRQNIAWGKLHGLYGMRFYASPNGGYSDTMISITNREVDNYRITNSNKVIQNYLVPDSVSDIIYVYNTTTLASAKSWIDSARNLRGPVRLLFHHLNKTGNGAPYC
jgi:hypothetical protein